MKCMDCVSVCPKGALYFGWGRPALATARPKRRYDFSWSEELALVLLFAASILTTVTLYGAVPLLFALRLSAISAFVLLTAARTLYLRNLRFGRFTLRRDGRTTSAGQLFLVAATLWALFLSHPALVRYYTFEGSRRLSTGLALYETAGGAQKPETKRELRAARKALQRAERLGLFAVANVYGSLASASSHLGDHAAAERHYARAVELAPGYAAARYELARYALARNDHRTASTQLREVLRLAPETGTAHAEMANLLIAQGRQQEAVTLLEELLERRPENGDFRLTYGLLLAHGGDRQGGLQETRRVLALDPRNAGARYLPDRRGWAAPE